MKRIVMALPVLLILSGCVTLQPLAHRKIDPPFWDGPKRQVVVAVGYIGQAEITREGGDWFYHLVVSDARDRGLYGVGRTYVPAVGDAVSAAVELFQARGFEARPANATPWGVSDFNRTRYVNGSMPDLISAGEQRQVDKDVYRDGTYRPAAEAMQHALGKLLLVERQRVHGDDLELVLSVPAWGFYRQYTGVFPIGAHHAYFDMRAELFDLKNATLLWTGRARSDVSITRDWNDPPEFAKVRAALDQAFRETAGALLDDLGAWEGKFAEFPPEGSGGFSSN